MIKFDTIELTNKDSESSVTSNNLDTSARETIDLNLLSMKSDLKTSNEDEAPEIHMNFLHAIEACEGSQTNQVTMKKNCEKGELFDIEQIIIMIIVIIIIIMCKRFSFSILIRLNKKNSMLSFTFLVVLSIVFVFFVYEIWFVEREKWLNWYDFCCIFFFFLRLFCVTHWSIYVRLFFLLHTTFSTLVSMLHSISICSSDKFFWWIKSATKNTPKRKNLLVIN